MDVTDNTIKLAQEIVKGGIGTILSVGLLVILWKFVAIFSDHMARQTEALETLVKIYSGS